MIFEEDNRAESALNVAKSMMVAARTAPKAKGIDNQVIVIFNRDEIVNISNKMIDLVEQSNYPQFFLRDANNILQADALFVIGTKISVLGITDCGMCGCDNCEEKKLNPNQPCSFNTGDLGIAIGSAVSVAADMRVDSRVMFSVGKAIKELNILGDDVKIIYGIPLSVSGKSPFFDR